MLRSNLSLIAPLLLCSLGSACYDGTAELPSGSTAGSDTTATGTTPGGTTDQADETTGASTATAGTTDAADSTGAEGSGDTTGEPGDPPLPDGYYQLEALDRGVVAMPVEGGIYVGWRMFGYDPDDIAFNLYRDGTKINETPLTASTNLVDPEGDPSAQYHVTSIIDGVEGSPSPSVGVWGEGYLEIPLQTPAGGSNPSGSYTYASNDGSVGDVDGDGQYEIIVKWDPSDAHDNSQAGYTGNVYIDAYEQDGTMLWRIDLGRNIRAGAHYTQFMVYDLDGDGRAEVAMKTAPGTIDGEGQPVLLGGDDPNADYRNGSGYVLDGPEYFTVFDGLTGAELATEPYIVPRGNVAAWGDNYGNRVDRFNGAIAFVDGTGRPSVIMARGYYTRAVLAAWNYRDGALSSVWVADSDEGTAYAGQGSHGLSIANVDDDLDQEIIYGAAAIDHDGTQLCTTNLGHGDTLHVSDFLPERPGQEVYLPHESGASRGASFRDARTCEIIWQLSSNGGSEGPGRGVMADVDPTSPGAEVWHNGSTTWSVAESVGANETNQMVVSGSGASSVNFVIQWDADPSLELLDGTSIRNYDGVGPNLDAEGCSSNNGTKSTPTLTADLVGDSREEVVFRCGSSLRIYSTTAVADDRMYTLMHDPQYRAAVAWQNTEYNQPPHTSFYRGEGMAPPPRPDMHVVVP